MAELYNYCTYSGKYGGKYQSSSWDVCCPPWTTKPPNPADFECEPDEEISWTVRPPNPAEYLCTPDSEVEWGKEPTPAPVDYDCIITDERRFKDCGD